MRERARLPLAASVMLLAACGAVPPAGSPAALPSASAAVAPPPPVRARWVFPHPERGLTAKLDLGGGRTLYVGQHGRRALTQGDDTLADAPTLALEHLAGVVREGVDFAFVADDGDVYVAHEPLGPLGATRDGPVGEPGEGGPAVFVTVATGREAIVGVTNDGRLLRTADFGRHWMPVDYAGSRRTFGHPYSVALDTKGNGLLLTLPQRLYVTRDDGATWAPIATPGIGADSVRRDGADKLFLQGPLGQAKLDDGKLVATRESVEPLRKPHASAPGSRSEPTRALLVGDRVVELTLRGGTRSSVEVSSHKLGEQESGAVAASEELVSTSPSGQKVVSPHVAGFGRTIIYARADETKNADGAATTTVLTSGDFGATWKTEATLEGHLLDHGVAEREMVSVAAGPAGWAFVRGLCPPGSGSESNGRCAHAQVRPAGGSSFQPLVDVDRFDALRFAFDVPHARVYALGKYDDKTYVYESPLAENRFVRTKILEATSAAGIVVDPGGVLRVLAYDSPSGGWKLFRHAADGTDSPALYVPIDYGVPAFAGLRGLVSGNHGSWETADGGETWSRIAVSGGGARDLACVDAGCMMMGGAERVGWELPAYSGVETAVASAEPRRRVALPRSPPPAPVATPAPIELACKPVGRATSVPSVPLLESVDLRAADVRWSEVKEDPDHKVSIVVGGRATVRELAMLGPEPHKQGVRTSVLRTPDGVVAVRALSVPGSGDPGPVDLEVVWWSASTGRVSRRSLPKVKPFVVPRLATIGQAHLVDGGLVFQSVSGEPVHFFRDDGHGRGDESVTIPKGTLVASMVRAGDRWVIPELSNGSARLTVSEDGASWTTKAWRLDEGAAMSLVSLGGRPHIGFAVSVGALPSFYTTVLVPLDAIPDDPPEAVTVARGPADAACDAAAGTYREAAPLTRGSRSLHVRTEEADKTISTESSSDQVAHPTSAGTLCTAAYRIKGAADGYLYAEPKGFSGVRFRRVPDPNEPAKQSFLAEPLACAATP